MNRLIYETIHDDDFVRGSVPMTKEDIRTLVLSKMRIESSSSVLDIGAGTGSISIECALRAFDGIVYSVEKEARAVDLIKQNIKKFNVSNIRLIEGSAPEALAGVKDFSRVFIGGSGGRLDSILEWLDKNMPDEGIIVINAITLDTLTSSLDFFRSNKYTARTVQVSITGIDDVKGRLMLRAQNPIFITSAMRGDR